MVASAVQRDVMVPEVTTVLAWHEAVNRGDVERLLALSSDDVEVGGPRGRGRGAQLLRDWFGRAGIRLTPRRIFCRRQTVVVEQEAEWRVPGNLGSDESAGRQVVASVFGVHDGRVTSVVRYPDLASALQAAGLAKADEVEVAVALKLRPSQEG